MGLDLAAIVRQPQAVETQHPDTAGALDPIIKALSNAEESTIGLAQARKLLGVPSDITIQRWIERSRPSHQARHLVTAGTAISDRRRSRGNGPVFCANGPEWAGMGRNGLASRARLTAPPPML